MQNFSGISQEFSVDLDNDYFSRNFRIENILGHGAQGVVFKVMQKNSSINQSLFAVKVIPISCSCILSNQSPQEVETAIREIEIFRYISLAYDSLDYQPKFRIPKYFYSWIEKRDVFLLSHPNAVKKIRRSRKAYLLFVQMELLEINSKQQFPSIAFHPDESNLNGYSVNTVAIEKDKKRVIKMDLRRLVKSLPKFFESLDTRRSIISIESGSFSETMDEILGLLSRKFCFNPGFITLRDHIERIHTCNLIEQPQQETLMNNLVCKNLMILQNLFRAMDFLHSLGVVHADLKPENLFIRNSDNMVGLCDFGLASWIGTKYRSIRNYGSLNLNEHNGICDHTCLDASQACCDGICEPSIDCFGTYPYSPNDTHFTEKNDIFSAGFILVELFLPFRTSMERSLILSELRRGGRVVAIDNQIERILRASIFYDQIDIEKTYESSELIWNFIDMIYRMTDINPMNRPGCESIQSIIQKLIHECKKSLKN